MKKIERIVSIIVLLLDNEIISTAELAERFEVNKRTIFRDIETIELAGFPIISHPGRKGGFSIMNTFKLRTYTYSGEEKQDILNALNVKESLFGIVDQQNIIKEKIQQMQSGTAKEQQPKARFSFESPTLHRLEIEKETKEKINKINQALKQNKKLQIKYIDNKGTYTQRVIHPYEMMLKNGSWYIYSYCESRSAYRDFKITRIRQIVMKKESFVAREHSKRRYIETNTEKIQLRFRKEDLGKLYDYYTEQEIQVTDSYIDVTFYADLQKNILPFLMMFGNDVRVIAPEKLKEMHKQEIGQRTETYC